MVGGSVPVAVMVSAQGEPITQVSAFALVISGATKGELAGNALRIQRIVPDRYSVRLVAASPSASPFAVAPVVEPK